MNLPVPLRAFRSRNFRLFFAGQTVSLIGTWMQQVAMAWLVYLITDSPWWLGVAGFAGQIPTFFLAPVAGVLVDRTNRHRLLIVTQILAMVQAFVVAGLDLAGVIEVWHILVMSVLLGVVNAFDITVRQTFMIDLVTERDELRQRDCVNSTMVNATHLIGPALAGLLLANTSPGVCFLMNGISYVAVLAGLLAMHVPPRTQKSGRTAVWLDFREGLGYSLGFGPIRALLLFLALVSLMGLSYSVLLPVFARVYLGGDAQTMGIFEPPPASAPSSLPSCSRRAAACSAWANGLRPLLPCSAWASLGFLTPVTWACRACA